MVIFLFKCLICFFSIYGMLCLFKYFVNKTKYKCISGIKHTIYVKNAEEGIEVYIRDLISKCPDISDITIIDENSDDNTYRILQKLKEIYPFIKII